MAEIKCPMCGKDNDENLDVCAFCDARLKPLLASDTGDDQEPYWRDSGEEKVDDSDLQEQKDEEIDAVSIDADAIDTDAMEWLRDLSSDLDEDQPDDEEPDEEEPDLPFVSDDEDDGDTDLPGLLDGGSGHQVERVVTA